MNILNKKNITSGNFSPAIVYGSYNVNININSSFNTELSGIPQERIKNYLLKASTIPEIKNLLSLCKNEYSRNILLETWLKLGVNENPSPLEILKFIEMILPEISSLGGWEFRRTLSLLCSNAILVGNDSDVYRKVNLISEIANQTSDGKIFLSSSIARNFLTSQRYYNILEDILSKKGHPQQSWQIFKAYESIPTLFKRKNLDILYKELSSKWNRRRFLTSITIALLHNKIDIKQKFKRDFLAKIIKQEESMFGSQFTQILSDWQLTRIGTNFLIIPSGKINKNRIINISSESSPFIPKNFAEIAKLPNTFDIACMDFELPQNRNKANIGGHYEIVVRWILQILTSVYKDFKEDVLFELTKCIDEGVRWAVARVLNEEFKTIPYKKKLNILKVLIIDENNWVVRECITTICSFQNDYDITTLAEILINRICQAQKVSFDERDELMTPFLNLVKKMPALGSYWIIKPTKGIEK